MANETVSAAASPAIVEDVFHGENVSFDEYSRYRAEGELPERFKPAETVADPAPAEETEEISEGEKPESEPESDPEDQQEKPAQPKKLTAEERIAQLEATIEKIRRGAGLKRGTEVAPVNQPAQSQPEPQPQYTRPKPTAEAKNNDGTPKYTTYEDFVEDLADWKAEQRWVAAERERAAQAQAAELQATLEDARERYENFDDVIQPAITAIVSDAKVSPVVKAMLNDSDLLPDLLFTLGSDQKELDSFLATARTNPGKAIRQIALTESLIREELTKGDAPTEPPAKQRTAAPPPPSPVSGPSARAFDVSDESLSPEEWMRKRNADLHKRGKA